MKEDGTNRRSIIMEEKIASILNEMSEYLSVSQTKKLQEVMLRVFSDREPDKKSHSNSEFLSLFLEAKRVEGCSIRTIDYYRSTIDKMLQKITIPVSSFKSWYDVDHIFYFITII